MARKKSTTQSAAHAPVASAPVAPVSETPVSASDTPPESVSETPVSASDTPPESVSETPGESASDTPPESGSDTPESGDTPPDEPVVRARDEAGHFAADNKGTQPDESKAGSAASKPVTAKAQAQAIRLVESYFGVGKVDKLTELEIIGALEVGHQPCIVRNSLGNEKFSLRVFDTVFDRNDKTKDAVSSSVVLNIARRLAHAGLYPTRE